MATTGTASASVKSCRREFCAARGIEFHAISSASGAGIPQLVRATADALDRLAPPEPLQENADDAADLQEPNENESPTPADPSVASPAVPRAEDR